MDCNVRIFQTAFDNKTNFVKIHAPKEVIERNAEIADMKPPVREFYITSYTNSKPDLRRHSKVFRIKQMPLIN